MAENIQKSLLPKSVPDVPGVSFAWVFEPSDLLSNDMFDVFLLDDRRVDLYLVEVSGHGVPAALVSMTVNRVLSGRASQDSLLKEHIGGSLCRLLPLSKVAHQLNKQFRMDPVARQYCALLYGMLDLETREFRYISAGYPGPIYQSPGGDTTVLWVHSFPIGLFEDVAYEECFIRLRLGDSLYFYSDGVTEAINERDEQFGRERLISAID